MIIQLLRVLRVKLAVHCTKKDQFCLCKATDGIFETGDNFACITWTTDRRIRQNTLPWKPTV